MIKLNILCVVMVITLSSSVCNAQKVIFISLFENLSKVKDNITYEARLTSSKITHKKSYKVDRFSEIPRTILEDIVINNGANVVERQSLDKLLLENKFISMSGLVDSTTAIKIGKFLGANTLIVGTISDLYMADKRVNSYGITMRTRNVGCNMRIRVLDVETGKILFSKRTKGSAKGIGNDVRYYDAIENALDKLSNDPKFIESIR